MAFIHDFDPFALQLNLNLGGFQFEGIRWYGLAYLSAFVFTYFTIVFLARRKATQLSEEQAADFVTYGALGVLIGGRVGYALFYAPELLWDFKSAMPFWGVLEVHRGGMSSHGGMIGTMISSYLWSRKYKHEYLHALDLHVLAGAVGFFFGRLANYVNGELYGRACDAAHWSATKFPQEIYRWIGKVSEGSGPEYQDSFERLKALGASAEALSPVNLSSGPTQFTQAEWSLWIERFSSLGSVIQNKVYEYADWLQVEIQSGNERAKALIEPVLTPRYPSQLYQAFFEGFLVFIVMAWFWKKPRKAGMMSGLFGMLYAVARVLGESYRLPDAQIGYELFGLTRGQWISFGLFAVGLAIYLIALKKSKREFGGWGVD
jgi:phosphatidylglycerol:prolipoprotein diacylglycerol transferase